MKRIILLIIFLFVLSITPVNAQYSFERDTFDNSAKSVSMFLNTLNFSEILFQKSFYKNGNSAYFMVLAQEGLLSAFLDTKPLELKINNIVYDLNNIDANVLYRGEGKALSYVQYSVPSSAIIALKNCNDVTMRVSFVAFDIDLLDKRKTPIPVYSQAITQVPPEILQEWKKVITTNPDGSITQEKEEVKPLN